MENKGARGPAGCVRLIEGLIITGATTGKVEANNTAIKNIKRIARGYRDASNYKSVVLLRSAVRTAA
ncbi:transposase [Arthrobacter sp. RT-1]|uniref:transposase n=1 Tax=Arthrobacter sp. RT-1 TaxID=2292263 RepID=UPI0015F1486C|nr:transposase [Arthrobacter sp. RT-1]